LGLNGKLIGKRIGLALRKWKVTHKPFYTQSILCSAVGKEEGCISMGQLVYYSDLFDLILWMFTFGIRVTGCKQKNMIKGANACYTIPCKNCDAAHCITML